MLGGSKGGDDAYEDDGDLSLSETKDRANDAATAFASALESEGRDPKRIVKAFCTLMTLCSHIEELEESGEKDDEEEAVEPEEETEAEPTEE